MKWMRQNGMEAAILKLAAANVPVLGICGGYQMLGESIEDPDGEEEAEACMEWGFCRFEPFLERKRCRPG